MKKLLVIPVAALALVGCGSHAKLGSSPQAKQATQKADAIIAKCLPDPLTLRSHAGRVAFMHCAVPPKNEKPFSICLEKVLLHGLPTKARLEQGGSACVEKYA